MVSQNEFLEVRIPIAATPVRGLPPIYPSFNLKTRRLPQEIWEQIVSVAQAWAQHGQEVMLSVTYETRHGYQLLVPRQLTGPASVVYCPRNRTVLEIHSHHQFPARFSAIDDTDEQRLCLYGVIGCLDQERPEVALRVGAYGYFRPVPWDSVFMGENGSFRDVHTEPDEQEGNDDLPR